MKQTRIPRRNPYSHSECASVALGAELNLGPYTCAAVALSALPLCLACHGCFIDGGKTLACQEVNHLIRVRHDLVEADDGWL